MKSNFILLLLFCIIRLTLFAQNNQIATLNLGDPAPPLRVRGWIKGTPVQRFETGNFYVVEFWATWCKPCIAAMPKLSALAKEYKDKVTFLGIDVYEMKATSIDHVKSFVDSMGQRMEYTVAVEDSNFIEADWFDASGERGIPKSFVVNQEGRVAWIGQPKDLSKVLPKIVNNIWDITEELAKRNLYKYLSALDDSLNYEFLRFSKNPHKADDLGKPDSALLFISDIVKNEPRLKYAPFMAFNTLNFLLQTNQYKAYEYGKEVLVTPSFTDPAYDAIIAAIEVNSANMHLSPEIYLLGAEAYKAEIDQIPYPELYNIPKLYQKMAACYWHANDKSKAISIQQKAIEELKRRNRYSASELAAFEFTLQQFKN